MAHKDDGSDIATTVTIFYGGLKLDNLGNLFGYGDVLLGNWSVPFTTSAFSG